MAASLGASMEALADATSYLREHESRMRETLRAWCEINSGSGNDCGLAAMFEALAAPFEPLADALEGVDLPTTSNEFGAHPPHGQALRARRREQAPFRVLLSGHMDTVYPADSPFQHVEEVSASLWRGPGVADMKGGLVVILFALEALEACRQGTRLGWELLVTPDEETGSHGSRGILREAAQRNHLGVVAEPSLPDGSAILGRKGSGTFRLVGRGREAHTGRDFAQGRNAIASLARAIVAVHALNDSLPGVHLNVGRISGGGALNVVPAQAEAWINVRISNKQDEARVREAIADILRDGSRDGITLSMTSSWNRPAKPETPSQRMLLESYRDTAARLGQKLTWANTGGGSDGNYLLLDGLAHLDGVGVRGGNLHSEEEFIELPSLLERSQLLAAWLLRLESGEITLPS